MADTWSNNYRIRQWAIVLSAEYQEMVILRHVLIAVPMARLGTRERVKYSERKLSKPKKTRKRKSKSKCKCAE